MKNKFFIPILVLLIGTQLNAALPEPIIAERGAHHRTWQRVSETLRPDGNVIKQTNSVVELGAGMHYQQEGQWVESQEVIELLQGGTGAIARQGPLNVAFSANINTAGAIDLSNEGKRFRSHVLGLAYTDAATGNSAMIAEIKDSIGQLVAQNQVVYPDAFTDFSADIRYTSRNGSFEQDVILRQNPPPPEAYGLSSQTTRLQVWTEFVEAPAGTKKPLTLRQEKDPQVRLTMAEPDLIDHSLDFGQTRIGPGKAFALDHLAGPSPHKNVPVGKEWTTIEGRTFLIESVEYPSLRTLLDALPAAAAVNPAKNRNQQMAALRQHKGLHRAQWVAMLPKAPAAREDKSKAEKIQLTAYKPAPKSVVIDYRQVTTTNNMVFKGDTTYYVSNAVSLSGTTIIEGGTVIKIAGDGIEQTDGTVVCLTSAYRPAILTSTDDNTVGETIAASTGNPAVCYNANLFACNYYLYLPGLGGTELKYLHLRYAHAGVIFDIDGATNTLSHVQFVHSQFAVFGDSTTIQFRNVLMNDVETALLGSYCIASAEHLTVNRCHQLTDDPGSTGTTLALTNCLLVYMTNWGNAVGSTNTIARIDDSSVFQTAGAAAHYLTANSPYRNAGTTNINATLLSELRTKTTYPPVVIPQGFYSNSLVLYPQAQRDTDAPDLGYHYDPIDYAFGAVVLENATLTLKPGAVMATYAPAANNSGLALYTNAKFYSEGTPTSLAYIVRHNTVQEQANTNWSARVSDNIMSFQGYTPEAQFRFTSWSVPAQDSYHFRAYNWDLLPVGFTDCQFSGGHIFTEEPALNFTNNLFERVYVKAEMSADGELNATFRNNTFFGGTVDFSHGDGSGTFTFKDNLFDKTSNSVVGTVTADYNAYLTNYSRVATGANDLVLTNSPTYQSNWLGRYYFPTNDGMLSRLINTGSQNATNAGLYHFTTATNQVKETNSMVDIGFHYVAVTNGVPFDTDGDTFADHFEDKNGNGVYAGAGESDWQSYTSPNGLGTGPGLQVFTPLK